MHDSNLIAKVLDWLDRAQGFPEEAHIWPSKGKYIGGNYDQIAGITRIFIGGLDILEAAKTNPIAYDEALKIVADCNPPYLRDFAAKVSQGKWLRPKTQGGRGQGIWCNHRRDYVVCIAVETLRRLGINPSRNDEPSSLSGCGLSGCDLVAKRLGLNFKTIKTIWGRRSDILKGSPGRYSLVEDVLKTVQHDMGRD